MHLILALVERLCSRKRVGNEATSGKIKIAIFALLLQRISCVSMFMCRTDLANTLRAVKASAYSTSSRYSSPLRISRLQMTATTSDRQSLLSSFAWLCIRKGTVKLRQHLGSSIWKRIDSPYIMFLHPTTYIPVSVAMRPRQILSLPTAV